MCDAEIDAPRYRNSLSPGRFRAPPRRRPDMKPRIAALVVCGASALLLQPCATKGFVREQVGSTETRLARGVATPQDQLKQTTERTAANTQRLEATNQRLVGLDGRVGELATTADGAKRDVATAMAAQKEADEATKQRFANRNRF